MATQQVFAKCTLNGRMNEEKRKILRYLKKNQFVWGEQSLTRRVMRETTGKIIRDLAY